MRTKDIQAAIMDVLKVGLVPMVTGSPGIGKSDLIRAIARIWNLYVIDLRLSQCDPTDLMGFPSHNNERMRYLAPEDLPLEGDEIPKGYSGWLIFLDECNSATLAVQAASYKLVLDRMVGQKNLHKNVALICAGNKETDSAIVNRMSTAMQSRLVHLEMDPDAKAWCEWATGAKLDHRAISYIEANPANLHVFDPSHQDKTFACPRTWEFASRLIDGKDEIPDYLFEALCGTLSKGIAHGFLAHINYYSKLPSIDDIIREPENITMTEEPAELFAIGHMIAAYITPQNADRVMRYVKRMPTEYASVSMRAALKRDEELIEKSDPVRDFAHGLAKEIF